MSGGEMYRCLVVANLTAESPSLTRAIREVVEVHPEHELVVLVPVFDSSLWHVLAGVGDRSFRLARERAARARARLEAAGGRVVSARLSLHQPEEAVELELCSGGFQSVLISTLPHPVSRWLHLDLPGRVAGRHPEIQVLHVTAPTDFYRDDAALHRAGPSG
jgi:hypothetical protein